MIPGNHGFKGSGDNGGGLAPGVTKETNATMSHGSGLQRLYPRTWLKS